MGVLICCVFLIRLGIQYTTHNINNWHFLLCLVYLCFCLTQPLIQIEVVSLIIYYTYYTRGGTGYLEIMQKEYYPESGNLRKVRRFQLTFWHITKMAENLWFWCFTWLFRSFWKCWKICWNAGVAHLKVWSANYLARLGMRLWLGIKTHGPLGEFNAWCPYHIQNVL